MFIHYGPSHGASLHTTNMDTNMDFMGTSWDFMGFHGISWDFMGTYPN